MALQSPSLDVGGAVLVTPKPTAGGRGYWQSVGRRLRRDPVTLICAAILILLVLASMAAPYLNLADPYKTSMLRRLHPIGSPNHWLGTDELGRDMFARLIYGGRLSLFMGVTPVVFALLIGGSLGILMPVVMVGSALGIFAYIVGRADYSRYLLFPHIPGAGELLIFCAALAGAGLAFLWFNANPAQVFMGDVGALSLGGALGTIAVITRQEIVLGIMGGIFVAEALSVMLQVSWFKYTKRRYGEGRRIFLMAPLHHHFEKKGWTETQVVVRFWIITMLLCLVGLASLKLR